VGAVMPKIESEKGLSWKRRTTKKQLLIWLGWLIGVSIIVFAWQLISEKTIWFFVQDAPRQAADIGVRMVPPKWSYMSKLLKPVWDTINIATIGTLIAIIIAVPVAFLAARNTTPHRIFRVVALFIIVSSRSVNSLIWALMLVFILGPGIVAGTIAIGLRSIGFCAKLLYEAIEEIDHSQVEAVEATGAKSSQKILYGIIPQVLPTIAGVAVYRWDINIRESTILGLVGAGGIGLQLNGSINTLAWTQVSMILIVIFITVLISEWVSAKVRYAII
jgi:phosphonate transport system permease protein